MTAFLHAKRLCASLLAVAVLSSIAAAQTTRPASIKITGERASGVYEVGEPITWTIDADAPADLHYRLSENNLKTLQEGTLAAHQTFTAHLDQPGWLYLEITDASKKMVSSAGAIVAPTKITPGAAKPDDFDAFWKSQIDQIGRVPANAKVTPGDSGVAGIDYAEVLLDNVDGAHVHAQLARPTKGEKFPAIVVFQYAGVYPLPKANVTYLAKQGFLALNVMAHDLPLHEDASFYAKLAAPGGALGNYVAIGDKNRDTSYFRKMLLGDYQAIEWLRTRPDWDGRVLVVRGESQGGMQSVAMAGLDRHVTEMIVSVPAGCDTMSFDAGRMPGWPYWHKQGSDDASKQAIMTTSRYYDPANFARTVACPAMISLGLRDTTACPANVIAMSNVLPGPHEWVIMPNATHTGNHQASVRRVTEWFQSLLTTGKPPPFTPVVPGNN